MPIPCQNGQYIQISLLPFPHSEMHCVGIHTTPGCPDTERERAINVVHEIDFAMTSNRRKVQG